MLIGACDPMLCPFLACRQAYKANGSAAEDTKYGKKAAKKAAKKRK